jgi:hypothetical protein
MIIFPMQVWPGAAVVKHRPDHIRKAAVTPLDEGIADTLVAVAVRSRRPSSFAGSGRRRMKDMEEQAFNTGSIGSRDWTEIKTTVRWY